MASILGLECKLYYNSGTYAAPTWAEWTSIINASLNLELGEADGSRRGSGGWRENLATLRNMTIEGDAFKDKDDTTFGLIEGHAQANTAFEVLIMDGPRLTTGSDGVRATCKVFSWNESQQLEEGVQISFTIRPVPNSDAVPAFVTAPQASSDD
jgi:hypothetical protein